MINRMTLNLHSVKMSSLLFTLCLLFSIFVRIRSETAICGEIRKEDSRIVGGKYVEYIKYPWFASLFMANNPRQLVCGGSLISKRYVATAAHCYKPIFKDVRAGKKTLEDEYVVKFGVTNSCIQEAAVETFGIIEVHIYNKYYTDLLYYDIALIELEAEVLSFMPICLPLRRYESINRTGLIGTIVGLGKEDFEAYRLPCNVKEGQVQIQADLQCRRMLDKIEANGSRMHDVFCAGSGNGDIDTCQGDSGGPLQITIDNIRYLLGLTSYGFGCAMKDTFGVYTDVSHFLDWIYEITKIVPPSPAAIVSPKQTNTHATKDTAQRPRPQPRHRKPARNILQQILNL